MWLVMQSDWILRLEKSRGFGIRQKHPIDNSNSLATADVSEVGESTRSLFDPEHWTFGDPAELVWIAGLIFLISYKTFRNDYRIHRFACFVACAIATIMFAMVVLAGNVDDAGRMLMMVLTVAAIGYSCGAVLFALVIWSNLDQAILAIFVKPIEPPSPSISETLVEIHNELKLQLEAIEKADIDQATKGDLIQTARDQAEAKMAHTIESCSKKPSGQ